MEHEINKTFWEFLGMQNSIEIPRIQRDYVQGVKDETGEIKGQQLVDAVLDAALDIDKIKNENPLVLDFIYGVIRDDGVFYPLDGQQRLTLLWLLHWYFALRCGKLEDKEVREKLDKFTYSTRTSSKQFMNSLCEKKFEYDINKGNIDEQIEDCSWFYAGWHNDPTIASMLVVLRCIDIRCQCQNKSNEDILNIWKRLTSNECNLRFHYLDLKQYAQPDDLFIKMNARGKLLEPLENFKSDLIKYLKDPKTKEKYDDIKQKWIRNLNGRWIEIFWELCNIEKYCTGKDEKSIPPSADTLFYRFICRIFIDRVILILNSESPDDKISVAKIANSDLWKNLYNAENRGKYSTLDPFIGREVESSDNDKQIEELLDREKLLESSMDDIGAIMENLIYGVNIISKINEWASPYWTKEHKVVEYIPSVQGEAGALSNDNRPIFHAVVSFIRFVPIKDEKDWESMFKAWMRFIWNIRQNSASHVFSLTCSIEKCANKLLSELESADQFYQRLAEIRDIVEPKTQLSWQVQEEIEKAYFRINDGNKDFIKVLESIEEDFEGQIYVFYKDDRKVSFPIDRDVLKERYSKWNAYKKLEKLRDKTKSLLQRFCNPDELIRFEFPKTNDTNLYNGKKLINDYPEICLRLLRAQSYKWAKENHILEALLEESKSNNLLRITEKIGRPSRCRFSKIWDRYNLHLPYSGGWHIPMDQRSVEIGKKIQYLQSLNENWHNDLDTKCEGYIYYDLTHWRTAIGKNKEIYFYLFKNIFASHEIPPSDIDGIISSDNCKPWGINEKVEKLEELLNDILNGSIKFVRIDYGTNIP